MRPLDVVAQQRVHPCVQAFKTDLRQVHLASGDGDLVTVRRDLLQCQVIGGRGCRIVQGGLLEGRRLRAGAANRPCQAILS